MAQPTAEHALHALEPLVGDWTAEAAWPSGEPWPGGGRSSFAWHPSKAHLVWTSTVDLPEAPTSTSVIGCDGANGTYTMLYADERGVSRIYAMTIDEHGWTLSRDGEPFAQRFFAEFQGGGNTMAARWERSEDDGSFVFDFTIVYRRVVG